MIVNSEVGLKEVVKKAMDCGSVALDTEFVWDRTYYPKLGLIQLGYTDGSSDLIDAISINDFSVLGLLLSDTNTTKILHDAVQDLVILSRITNTYPVSIFDSQRAAGFIGLSSTISLGQLLKEVLNVHLDKSETQSDWCARPLSEKQIRYAKEDVCHGVALMEAILKLADRRKHKEWLIEEMNLYNLESYYIEKDPKEMSPKVKKSGDLSYSQKELMRVLFAWRESLARKENLPRTFILQDEILVHLSKHPPKNLVELRGKNLGKRFYRKFINSLWEAIDQSKSKPLKPLEIVSRKYNKIDALEAQIDLALAFIKGVSLANGIDPALIGNRASITSFVYAVSEDKNNLDSQDLYKGWRKVFCGKSLSDLLSGIGSIKVDALQKVPIFVA